MNKQDHDGKRRQKNSVKQKNGEPARIAGAALVSAEHGVNPLLLLLLHFRPSSSKERAVRPAHPDPGEAVHGGLPTGLRGGRLDGVGNVQPPSVQTRQGQNDAR